MSGRGWRAGLVSALLGLRLAALQAQGDTRAPRPECEDSTVRSAAAAGTSDAALVGAATRRIGACASQWTEQQEGEFSVPESPAFTFLNTSPAEITRPNNWRQFSAALLSGVGPGGTAQQGFALEIAPFQVIPGFQISLHDYQTNFFKRAAHRAMVSLGTTQASGDSSSTDLAIGIRVPLVEDHDLILSAAYMKELGDSLLRCAPDHPGLTPEELEQSRACLQSQKLFVDSQYHALQDQRSDWRRREVIVAFAAGARLVNSSFKDYQGLGWSAWALGANPLGHWGYLIGSVTYSKRQDVPGSPAYNSVRYGGRAVVGSPRVNAFLEVVGESRFNRSPGVDPGNASWSGGIETRIASGLWLSTGFGQRYATATAADRVVVIANIRWGLSGGSRGLTDSLRDTPQP